MIVSNTKPSARNNFPGDKHTGLEPAILFYEVEDDDTMIIMIVEMKQ